MKTINCKCFIDFRKEWSLNSNEKPSFDAIFMQLAILISTRSSCRRSQFGAVITKNNKILGVGYNGAPSGAIECADRTECVLDANGSCMDSIHAEQNAIINCARNGVDLDGSTIYVQSIPCLACAKIIVAAGIITYKCLHQDYRIKDGKLFLEEHKVSCVFM